MAPWLEAALASSPSPDTLLDVYHLLTTDSSYALLVSDQGVYVTHVGVFAGHLQLHVWLAGGNMAGMRELYPLAEALGRALGCESMTLIGRAGWLRSFLIHEEGWRLAEVHLEKRF